MTRDDRHAIGQSGTHRPGKKPLYNAAQPPLRDRRRSSHTAGRSQQLLPKTDGSRGRPARRWRRRNRQRIGSLLGLNPPDGRLPGCGTAHHGFLPIVVRKQPLIQVASMQNLPIVGRKPAHPHHAVVLLDAPVKLHKLLDSELFSTRISSSSNTSR